MNDTELINYLKSKGYITEGQLREAEHSILTAKMKQNIEQLHLNFCGLNHDTKECKWYEEEQQAETWEMKSHQRWVLSFRKFLFIANSSKSIPE